MATYTVNKGDTLQTIGAKFGVAWQTIASTNGIVNPYPLYVGQNIVIPNGSSVTTNMGGLAEPTAILDKIIGGVLLYGIFKVLMKVF